MSLSHTNVSCEVHTLTIPTYEVGKPDRNPRFIEHRVYQGSSGKVYPYPVIEKNSRRACRPWVEGCHTAQ